MNISETIRRRLDEAFSPQHLEIINESHMHAGPATESHFKLVMVSDDFAGARRVARHQKVYKALADLMQSTGSGSIHALALHLFTAAEWQQSQVPDSPLCSGKNK